MRQNHSSFDYIGLLPSVIYYLSNVGRVMLTDPSPSSRTTQLVPVCFGFDVESGGVLVIAFWWRMDSLTVLDVVV